MEILNIELIQKIIEKAEAFARAFRKANKGEVVAFSSFFEDSAERLAFRNFLDKESFDDLKSVLALFYIGRNKASKINQSSYDFFKLYMDYINSLVTKKSIAIELIINNSLILNDDLSYSLDVLEIDDCGVISTEIPLDKIEGLYCKACGKPLFNNVSSALINFVTNEEDKIIMVAPFCKESCDEIFFCGVSDENYVFFKELRNFTNPMLFLREILNIMSRIESGKGFLNEEILDSYQDILCACSPKVLRMDFSEKEKEDLKHWAMLP